MTPRAIDATPESLFATFLDGLREIHARDGMRGVTRVALAAAAGIRSAAGNGGAVAAADSPRAPPDPRAARAFGAIEAALEDAFGRGGLEEAIGELSRIGAVLERAAGMHGGTASAGARRGARSPRPPAPPESDDVRRARRFARDAFERATRGGER